MNVSCFRDDGLVDDPSLPEPPPEVVLSLDEALDLLAALEDARDALIQSGHLAVVVIVEVEVRRISRRLGFDDPEGRDHGD